MAEKEYIEKEAAIKLLYDNIHLPIDSGTARAYWTRVVQIKNALIRHIAKMPAADVVEVRHGAWIIKINYKTPVSHAYIRKEKLYICPYCGKAYRQHMNFCGHCGAKMDGGKDG